jgi:hypothetical protein
MTAALSLATLLACAAVVFWAANELLKVDPDQLRMQRKAARIRLEARRSIGRSKAILNQGSRDIRNLARRSRLR